MGIYDSDLPDCNGRASARIELGYSSVGVRIKMADKQTGNQVQFASAQLDVANAQLIDRRGNSIL